MASEKSDMKDDNGESGALNPSEPVVEIKKMRYPIGIPFIIINKLFERFAFLAIQTVLVIYLTSELSYTEAGATVVYHASMGLQFVAAIIGAIISDSYLGKYRTIMFMSTLYCLGAAILLLGSLPGYSLPSSITFLSLILMSLGVGFIKPCTLAFSGDQFKLPEQAKQMASIFSVIYMALKAGLLVSATFAPILRHDVQCFGQDHCFPLVFGASLVFAFLAIGSFAAGSRWYRKIPASGSTILKVCHCIKFAWSNNTNTSTTVRWLDRSIPKFGKQLVDDTKSVLRILIMYIPIPMYWALNEQIGSRFTIQATHMNGNLPFYTIKPDQFQVMHPLLIVLLIPVFDIYIYPLLSRIGLKKHLTKMAIGGLLTASSFLLTGFLELNISPTHAVLPNPGECQLRIFNPLACNFDVETLLPGHEHFTVDSMQSVLRNIRVNKFELHEFRLKSKTSQCDDMVTNFQLTSNLAVSYLLQPNSTSFFEENVKKSVTGKHSLRILRANTNQSVFVIDTVSNRTQFKGIPNMEMQIPLVSSDYSISVNGIPILHTTFLPGGVSTLLVAFNGFNHTLIEITPPNSVHMLWQLPQYVCMAMGDIFFSITGIAFNYTEAPANLKTLMQALWLFLLAIGNGIDMVVIGSRFFESQAIEFFAFAALMCADMLVFKWLANRYYKSKAAAMNEELAMK